MTFRFDHPEMLWLSLLALPVVWLGYRSMVTVDPLRRSAAVLLRLALLAAMILLLAGLETVRTHHGLSVIAAVDHSQSVRQFTIPTADIDPDASPESSVISPQVKHWLEAAGQKRRPDDRIGVIRFDGQPTVLALPAPQLNLQYGADTPPAEGTDAARALRLAMAQLPADTSGRLLLVSDGNDAHLAELLAAAHEARAVGLTVDVLPIDYRLQNEVTVDSLYAPLTASRGQTVALRIVLRATGPVQGTLHLLHDDLPIDLTADPATTGLPITPDNWTRPQAVLQDEAGNPQYLCVQVVEVPHLATGANRFKAIFQPAADTDRVQVNNQAQGFTLVKGRGKVLLVADPMQFEDNPLAAALLQHDIDLQQVRSHGLDHSLINLQRYDAIILHNIAADEVTAARQQAIERYVHELGGGLLMVGGVNGFGAGGWTGGPVDRTLPVNCEVPSRQVLLSGALVLVLDRSGSMGKRVGNSRYTQQEIANEAALLALQTLFKEDYVGVIAFDNEAKWVQPLAKNDNALATAKKISRIEPRGGTHLYPALVQAYQSLSQLQPRDAAVRHVIVLSDGKSQPGQFDDIAAKMAAAGITVSTVGVGDEIDKPLLAKLARTAGGTFHPVTNPFDLPQVFIKEARTVRQSLIRDKTFQPVTLDVGSPITARLSDLPPLHGMVLTHPKADPRVFLAAVGIDDAPLFAHWQYGLGTAAAFTSEAAGSWAADWLDWPGYADFWARTVRTIARPPAGRQHDLIASVHGNRLKLRVETSQVDAAVAQIQGAVLTPTGQTLPTRLQQTAPGVFESQLTVADTGNYIVSLRVKDSAGQAQTLIGGATRLPGAELRAFASNRDVLEQVAAITGGRVLSLETADPDMLFDRRGITATRSIQPLTRPLLLLLAAVLLCDIAVRRIAWDAAGLKRRLLNFLGLSAVDSSRGEDAARTLANLRSRTGEPDRPAAQPASAAPQPDISAIPENQDWRTYEQPEQAAHEAGEQPPAEIELDRDPEATTSRLLAARRRARDDQNKNG